MKKLVVIFLVISVLIISINFVYARCGDGSCVSDEINTCEEDCSGVEDYLIINEYFVISFPPQEPLTSESELIAGKATCGAKYELGEDVVMVEIIELANRDLTNKMFDTELIEDDIALIFPDGHVIVESQRDQYMWINGYFVIKIKLRLIDGIYPEDYGKVFSLRRDSMIKILKEYLEKYPSELDSQLGIAVESVTDDFLYGIIEEETFEEKNISCADSDDGKNYYVRGTTFGFADFTNYQLIITKDTCTDSLSVFDVEFLDVNTISTTVYAGDVSSRPYLAELYCKDGSLEADIYTCPYGCLDGACIKIEPTEETGPIDLPEEIEVEEEIGICNGCELDNKCYPFGYRKSGEYCSDNYEFVEQLETGICENNFECKSNVCVSGECVGLNLIQKIINWFKRIFVK